MKKKTYRTSATIQLPLSDESNPHTFNINGNIHHVYWGKPVIKKQEFDYMITFDDKKLVWFVDRVYYHDLIKMREEAKSKTEVLK